MMLILNRNNFYKLLILLFLNGMTCFTPLFAQQNNQFQANNYTIDEAWKFSKEDTPESYKASFSDKNSSTVSIPHTWNNEDAVDETPGFFRGACWYRRNVFIGDEAKGKNTLINFEGAYQVVDLYINEKWVEIPRLLLILRNMYKLGNQICLPSKWIIPMMKTFRL